ncbi:MAG: peptidyl-tRNA hydrolase Pth2 [Thermoplasmataceae archaeon]|jgi:PTH2 family peptidyl-tRNA hydrolase
MVESVKMVIAIRKDLDMGKGKIAAQAAHAAVSCALKSEKDDKKIFREWISQGQKKIVIRLESLEAVMRLKTILDQVGITSCLITDAGFTQIMPGTVTCLGIGPVEESKIDPITGMFPLL